MATKKNLPARRPAEDPKHVAAMVVARVADSVAEVIRPALNLGNQIEDAVKALTGGNHGAVQAHRERQFIERIEAFERYAESGLPPWVAQHVQDSACPRGALSIASAYTLGLEFVEEHYARYVAAYGAARARAAKDGAPRVCGECGRAFSGPEVTR
jgi:hypothetical protein